MVQKKIQVEDASASDPADSVETVPTASSPATASSKAKKSPARKQTKRRASTKTTASKAKSARRSQSVQSKTTPSSNKQRLTAPLLEEVPQATSDLSPAVEAVAPEPEAAESITETSDTSTLAKPTETPAESTSQALETAETAATTKPEISKPKTWHIPKWQHPTWTIAAAVSSLLVVAVGWGLCSVYRSQIVIGSTVMSARLDDTALTKAFVQQTEKYRIVIQHPDGAKHAFPLQQAGLTLNTVDSVQATRQKQHDLGKRLRWWQPTPAVLDYKVDQATFNTFIARTTHVTVQPSQDAVLSIADGHITIKDAVAGKQYGLSQPRHTFLAAARQLRTEPIKLRTLTVNPALTAQSLETYKPLLEKTLEQPISLSIGDKVIVPTSADIAAWLEITPDTKTKKVNIAVNSGKVQAYIDKKAAADIRPARAQVETTRDDGTIQLLVAGSDGVDVPGKAAAAAAIAKTLLKGEGITHSLPTRYDRFQTINTGLYDKWIEVDLTAKRMYAYEKTALVKTDLVTAGAPATPTVTGQYAVYAKFGQQDMRGRNVDGSNYFQPRVRFISYFYKDYAIHGNYWRPLSYFGNINSSHGCVSLPDVEAEWIYNWAAIGTPVIVHT